MRQIIQAIAIAILLFSCPITWAQQSETRIPAELLEAYRDLESRIAEDPGLLDEVIDTGRERARFCNTCHGPDGSAERPNYPSLAGQNAVYLLDQFDQFASGERKKEWMNMLAEQISVEEMVTLSIYYSQMPLVSADFDPELADRGSMPYDRYCTQCHGSDGLGGEGYARIAGQQPIYMKSVLRGYRSGETSRRPSEMHGIVRALSDRDIESLAHHIASLGENR